MEPCYTPAVGLPPPLHLTRHFSPSPEHTEHAGPWALGTGQGVCCVVNVSPPLFQFPHPLYRPSVFPRPPDAANTGSAHFKSLRSPALISTPQNTRLAFITRTLRGSFISPTPQLRQIKGLVATSLPVWQPCSRSLRRAPPSHQDTPELDASSSVWNRPSELLHASFVISGRHGHQVDREPGPASLLVGTASLYELRSRIIVSFLCSDLTGLYALDTTDSVCIVCRRTEDCTTSQHVQRLPPQCRILLTTPQFVSLPSVGGCRVDRDHVSVSHSSII